MTIINFYVGVNPEDKPLFWDCIHSLNDGDTDTKYHVHVKEAFDDPHGYYTYRVSGTFDGYKCFMNKPFVKSLEHFED